jgi:hypothetical protein
MVKLGVWVALLLCGCCWLSGCTWEEVEINGVKWATRDGDDHVTLVVNVRCRTSGEWSCRPDELRATWCDHTELDPCTSKPLATARVMLPQLDDEEEKYPTLVSDRVVPQRFGVVFSLSTRNTRPGDETVLQSP